MKLAKSCSVIFLAGSCWWQCAAQIVWASAQPTDMSPFTTILVFDFHNVLATKKQRSWTHNVKEHVLMPATVHLVHELKQLGYRLYLYSNIKPPTFGGLQTISDFAHFFSIFDGIQIARPEWGKKPQPCSYHRFLTTFNPTRSWQTLFIDDKPVNVHAALEAGFTGGIIFESPNQLWADLALLGIAPRCRSRAEKPPLSRGPNPL